MLSRNNHTYGDYESTKSRNSSMTPTMRITPPNGQFTNSVLLMLIDNENQVGIDIKQQQQQQQEQQQQTMQLKPIAKQASS